MQLPAVTATEWQPRLIFWNLFLAFNYVIIFYQFFFYVIYLSCICVVMKQINYSSWIASGPLNWSQTFVRLSHKKMTFYAPPSLPIQLVYVLGTTNYRYSLIPRLCLRITCFEVQRKVWWWCDLKFLTASAKNVFVLLFLLLNFYKNCLLSIEPVRNDIKLLKNRLLVFSPDHLKTEAVSPKNS